MDPVQNSVQSTLWWEVLKRSAHASVNKTQVITFDVAVYMKAKQIQWKASQEFQHAVIRMGGLHIALNFLSVIGKIFAESGHEDLLVESGVYAAGSTSALLAREVSVHISWLGRHFSISLWSHLRNVGRKTDWRATSCRQGRDVQYD